MVTLFGFTKHNKDKMLILAHRKINVLYLWLVSLKYIYRLQSYGQSPITSGSPLVLSKHGIQGTETVRLHKLFCTFVEKQISTTEELEFYDFKKHVRTTYSYT